MPPKLAALLTWSFIIWLFRRDIRQKPNVSAALWIPFLWLFIECSRPPAEWLTMFGLPVPGGSSLEGGTPVDSCFQVGIMVAGLLVLQRRGATLGEFVRNNVWIVIFIGYCLLSVCWSDWTFVALKRWIKDLDLPIMAMVILTEADPMEALSRLIKRAAYVLIPVSILFAKYYLNWDRVYDDWSGTMENSGIAINKNFLGLDCFLTAFFFIWYMYRLFKVPREIRDKSWRNEVLLSIGFLAMIWWLFNVSNSRTPLVALTVGVLVMFISGWNKIRKEYIGVYLIVGALLIYGIQMTFDVYGSTIEFLGRNPTLTDRTFLWHDLLRMNINPVIGVGFESFWMGKQMELPHEWETELNESHNGYLETYLTLGIAGEALLLAMLFAAYRNACAELLRNVEWGCFRLGFLVALLIYNWTEAAYRGIDPLMQMFYIIAITAPQPLFAAQPIADTVQTIKSPELANEGVGAGMRITPSTECNMQ
jgi:exopolysaccharide production protein ExoQ